MALIRGRVRTRRFCPLAHTYLHPRSFRAITRLECRRQPVLALSLSPFSKSSGPIVSSCLFIVSLTYPSAGISRPFLLGQERDKFNHAYPTTTRTKYSLNRSCLSLYSSQTFLSPPSQIVAARCRFPMNAPCYLTNSKGLAKNKSLVVIPDSRSRQSSQLPSFLDNRALRWLPVAAPNNHFQTTVFRQRCPTTTT